MRAVAHEGRGHPAGRRVERDDALLARRNEAVLERERHAADRAMAADRQAAGDLDVEDRDVAIGPQRRVEDRARHRVVAARLEHQRASYPIEASDEILPLLAHRRAVSNGPPPITRRTGLPQVWPSMQEKICGPAAPVSLIRRYWGCRFGISIGTQL
jgi:hypothetical protein